MRFCRFGEGRLGLVEGANARDVTAALDVLPSYRYPLPAYDPLIAHLDGVAERARTIAAAPVVPLSSLKLLSPVANPGKVVAAPVNYKKHAQEVRENAALHNNNPALFKPITEIGLFLKASSSVTGPGDGIALRMPERRNDHEVELAFVIGKEARQVSRADALEYVAGYCIGLDITIRGPEDRSFRKSPDTYTVLGPWLVTADEIPEPGTLDLRLSVNGQLRQSSNTRDMVLSVPELIELASRFYTLYPGDVVMTGTPEGVGPLVPGDTIEAYVEHVGVMEVPVRAFAEAPAAASGIVTV